MNLRRPVNSTIRRLIGEFEFRGKRLVHKRVLIYRILALGTTTLIAVSSYAQDKRAKDFEKLVGGSEPLFVDGERVYRVREVSHAAIVTVKPEPSYTDKARKKRAHGTVEIRAVMKSSGEMKLLNVLKRLPYGLTEQALDAATRIQFKPALLDGKPVSQIILLQYSFNRN
jgi:TonB family protein